jgi:hypothetical protein
LYLVLGWVFVAVGVVGAALPVIPTTGPLLLALWFFSQSSERFHHWLYFHPVFGPRLQAWKRERVIPPKVKATAYASMGLSFTAISLAGASWVVLAATGAFMLVGVVFIARCPSRSALPPEPKP